MLRWIDPANADNFPARATDTDTRSLERGAAGERFRLRCRKRTFREICPSKHSLSASTTQAPDARSGRAASTSPDIAMRSPMRLSTKAGWSVLPDDIVLGFFSFAKFLMYRDLDPKNWPADASITGHPTIRALLADGFPRPDAMLSEDARVDDHIPPAAMLHILDCDSSQTLAVHDARSGRNLVIQGPPGTGKSQTIANIIASAIADGRTVLFVAEKMAALEVVKRRLDQAGVGDACLELHSNKTNKRLLLDEFRRTWQLGSPRGDLPDRLSGSLEEAQSVLMRIPTGCTLRIERGAHAVSGLRASRSSQAGWPEAKRPAARKARDMVFGRCSEPASTACGAGTPGRGYRPAERAPLARRRARSGHTAHRRSPHVSNNRAEIRLGDVVHGTARSCPRTRG